MLQKRLAAQVVSVEPDQIESIIARLATAGQEVIEVRASPLIQHHDFAIQDRPLPFQTAQNLLKKRVKQDYLDAMSEYRSAARLGSGVKQPRKQTKTC